MVHLKINPWKFGESFWTPHHFSGSFAKFRWRVPFLLEDNISAKPRLTFTVAQRSVGTRWTSTTCGFPHLGRVVLSPLGLLGSILSKWVVFSPTYIWSILLVGGFNPFEKCLSKWESSPNRRENKKYLKPPPRLGFVTHWSQALKPTSWDIQVGGTVDASEIPRPTTVWMVLKPCKW